ncbi:8201_t:CDS:2 [Paraglomus occultum]|uniref:8201_t:CDS:1 n=1 Tax=Paraglomus occultum TaxID=144539 RepID=A0A9N9CEP4_9GLOM|nr:8201_t:CDS:2 [Paraglomus occultum]
MSITILPHRLRLLSIPKASLHLFAQSLTRNIVFPPDDQPIFSITETAVEISIVADAETVERDFARFREGNNIEIMDDLFRALVLGDEGLDNSGKRINDISYFLSRVGVSVFYLSTYQEDIALVKEKNLPLVMQTLCPTFTFTNGSPSFSSIPSLIPTDRSVPSPPAEDDDEPFQPEQMSFAVPLTAERPFDSPVIMVGDSSHMHSDNPFFSGMMVEFEDQGTMRKREITNDEEIAAEVRRQCTKRVTPHRLKMGVHRKRETNSLEATSEGITIVTDETVLKEFPEHTLNMSSVPILLRCIYIDISRFGLDKYGVLYSISNPLISNGINLLYLSTLKTANVLVQHCDLDRSFRILAQTAQQS